jgi:hypothetical protein
MILKKHAKDIKRFVAAGDYEQTDEGILIHKSIMWAGEFTEGIKGQEDSFRTHKNLIVNAGINHILNVALGATAKPAAYYVAPTTAGGVTATWTMTEAAAVEGGSYTSPSTNTIRHTWTAGTASSQYIDNLAAKASLPITGSVTYVGAFLTTGNTRASSSGVLVSMATFTSRVLANSDTWELGYKVTLSDS